MEKQFSRSLMGYDPVYVEDLINKLKKEYEEDIQELQVELQSITSDVETIKNNIEILRKEVDIMDSFEKELGGALYKTYMETSSNVLSGIKKVEEMELQKINMVRQLEENYNNLQATLKNLVHEFRGKVGQYKSELGASENGRTKKECTK